jgi:hypothetical protein
MVAALKGPGGAFFVKDHGTIATCIVFGEDQTTEVRNMMVGGIPVSFWAEKKNPRDGSE